ncbi:hypothetical protein ACUV84_018048 [Puccinellia chinampoensis]
MGELRAELAVVQGREIAAARTAAERSWEGRLQVERDQLATAQGGLQSLREEVGGVCQELHDVGEDLKQKSTNLDRTRKRLKECLVQLGLATDDHDNISMQRRRDADAFLSLAAKANEPLRGLGHPS